MNRYKTKVANVNHIISLDLEFYSCKEEQVKTMTIKEGDLLSFLYVKDLSQVGTCAEEIVKGRIAKIYVEVVRDLNPSNYNPNYTERNRRSSIQSKDFDPANAEVDITKFYKPGGLVYDRHFPNMYKILVDTSSTYESNAVWINVERILDIQPIDYEWDTTNTAQLVPEIPEMTFWEDREDQAGSKNNYIGKEYNRPHPSIK